MYPLRDLIVEPAKSSRSTCKSCTDKIIKGSLRIGDQIDTGDYVMTRWYHSGCYFGNNFDARKCRNDRRDGDKKVTTGNMSDIPGFLGLTMELKATLKADINKKKHKSLSSTKPSRTTQSKSKKRKLTDSGSSKEIEQVSPSELTTQSLKKRLMCLGLPSSGKKTDLCARLNDALGKKPEGSKKKRKVASKNSGLTDVEKAQKLAEELKVKTVKVLKQMLRDNCQPVSGSKAELVARVADRMLFGCIPECPDCGNNRGLKVIYQDANHRGQGKWLHRGYFDDDGEFEPCGFKGTHVERYSWTDMDC